MTEYEIKRLCDRVGELWKENQLLGERCNQLLKDKGDLTDKIEEMKCCGNCKHKKSEIDRCELLMYSLNACLCKNKDKWELKND